MLDHALRINAKEQTQRFIASMLPYMSVKDRKAVIASNNKIIEDNEPADSAIIKSDRERLRRILSGKKTWLEPK